MKVLNSSQSISGPCGVGTSTSGHSSRRSVLHGGTNLPVAMHISPFSGSASGTQKRHIVQFFGIFMPLIITDIWFSFLCFDCFQKSLQHFQRVIDIAPCDGSVLWLGYFDQRTSGMPPLYIALAIFAQRIIEPLTPHRPIIRPLRLKHACNTPLWHLHTLDQYAHLQPLLVSLRKRSPCHDMRI